MNTAYAPAMDGSTWRMTAKVERPHAMNTQDLSLRTVEMDDLENYGELLRDPAVMRFVGLDAGKLLADEELESLVYGAVKAWKTRGYGRWSIFDKATGEFMGFCGFRCEDGVPELICMLFEKHWGSGASKAAADACLNYGWDHLGFDKVIAFTRPEHGRARGLLKKLGARLKGQVDFHGVEGVAYELHRKPQGV